MRKITDKQRADQKVVASQHPAAKKTTAGSSSTANIEHLQRTAGNQAVLHMLQQNTGQRLDPNTRRFMEASFGHDFGAVRLHTDKRATDSADAVNASAYTIGEDIVIGKGQPSPETFDGKKLLAHELAHVVQQSRGGATPVLHSSGPHERDADAAATAAAAGQPNVTVRQSTGVGLARQPK